MNNYPSWKMRPEDYLCCAGLVIGGIVVLAASWTTNIYTADHLIGVGDNTLGGFFVLWIITKIIRFFAD